jgi:hypothetical protein
MNEIKYKTWLERIYDVMNVKRNNQYKWFTHHMIQQELGILSKDNNKNTYRYLSRLIQRGYVERAAAPQEVNKNVLRPKVAGSKYVYRLTGRPYKAKTWQLRNQDAREYDEKFRRRQVAKKYPEWFRELLK